MGKWCSPTSTLEEAKYAGKAVLTYLHLGRGHICRKSPTYITPKSMDVSMI
jgi:hypothetical protein